MEEKQVMRLMTLFSKIENVMNTYLSLRVHWELGWARVGRSAPTSKEKDG
jgi:hypothetical protein